MYESKKYIAVDTADIRTGGLCTERDVPRARQRGSILVGLIITMVVMASLGAGMVYLTSTATFQEILANNHARAQYVAESGGRYANALIRQALATGAPAFSSLNADYFSNPYTLANGDQFNITYWTPATVGGSMHVTYDSIGTAGSGFMQAKVRLRYRINPANQMSGTGGASGPPPSQYALPRPASDFDISKQDLDIYYSPVDMSQVDIKDNPFVQNDRALNLKADYYVMGLKWYANTTEMLQLDSVRTANSGLLNYRAQVKILDNNKDHSNLFNIIGISFRLDDTATSAMSTDLAFPDMYGISFVKLPSAKPALNSNDLRNSPQWYQDVIYPNPAWDFLSSGSAAGKWHAVLWKRNAEPLGTHTPLAYQKLTAANWACSIGTADNCIEIKDWSTIYVDVEEKLGSAGDTYGFTNPAQRYNVIKSYMQGGSVINSLPPNPPGPYLRSTTAVPQDIWWEDNDLLTPPVSIASPIYQPINWTLIGGSGAVLGSPANIIADAAKTTLNYDSYTSTTTPKAREIGLHIYNVRTNAQNIFYDNFYIDLSPSGVSGGGLIDGTGQVVVSP
jgi:hypothetical protein